MQRERERKSEREGCGERRVGRGSGGRGRELVGDVGERRIG